MKTSIGLKQEPLKEENNNENKTKNLLLFFYHFLWIMNNEILDASGVIDAPGNRQLFNYPWPYMPNQYTVKEAKQTYFTETRLNTF